MKKSDFRAFDHGQTSSTEHAQYVLLCLLQYVHMYHLEFTLENNHVRYLLRYLGKLTFIQNRHCSIYILDVHITVLQITIQSKNFVQSKQMAGLVV